MRERHIILSLLFLLMTTPAKGQLYLLETDHLNLIYIGKIQEYLTPHVIACFENARRYHQERFNYHSREKTTIFLQDFWDYGNAGATALPRNRVSVGIAPLNYTFETSPANERINHTMNHELVHIVASDKAATSDNFYRKIFLGKATPSAEDPLSMAYSYLTNPRWYAPRWYHEGIAVFMETCMAGGLGRAMGPYDEMVFRTMVRDSAYIYDVVGLESEGTTVDFQVGTNSYLYGTRFMSYLAYRHGPDSLLQWISGTRGRKSYFASDFKQIYGTSLDQEWSRWIRWEHDFQQANLDSIRVDPTTDYRPVVNTALGSVSRAYYDETDRQLYVAILYPGATAHIARIDITTGRLKKITDVKGPALYYVTSLAYDPDRQILFYTTKNGAWRDLNALELKTGRTKKLLSDVRTGDLTFNRADRTLWGVRHFNGISTIVRIPHPYLEWNQVYSFPYGQDIYDIDISPDGRMLVGAMAQANGRQFLIRMNTDSLMHGKSSYDTLFDFENSNPANFVFSADGNFLYGSSYYSGVSNIYRYDLLREDMDILSNGESGFFRPLPISQDSLVAFRYTGQGFVPVVIAIKSPQHVGNITFLGNQLVKKYPVLKSWMLGAPGKITADSLIRSSGPYRPLSGIRLNSAYPIVEGYKEYTAFGIRLDLSDRIGLAGMNINLSISPQANLNSEEYLHAKMKFYYWGWEILATYNRADFYDLFGPTRTSRKGYSLGFKYRKTLIYDLPRILDLAVYSSGFGGLETLPLYQNVSASYDRSVSFGATLNYRHLLKTLGAVDDEKGYAFNLNSHNNYVNQQLIPQLFSNFDYGFLLPIPHSSLWLRSSAGYAFGDREEPFANFYFGGFGNNWIDYQEFKRYREYYSFPGVPLNQIGGINYGKLMVEWTLPPWRFRRFGFTSMYFRWLQLAVFSGGVVTNFDEPSLQDSRMNLGAQLDLRLVTFTHFNSTFSLGYAVARDKEQKISHEFMVSLKIL